LHDIYLIKAENLENIDLHLGASEGLVYHSALMKPKSKIELDWLRKPHEWDKMEDGMDKYWTCAKVLNQDVDIL
jgi:acid phosphatase class B